MNYRPFFRQISCFFINSSEFNTISPLKICRLVFRIGLSRNSGEGIIMKLTTILLSFLLISSQSFAECNTSRLKADLLNMFEVGNSPVDWRSVKKKDSFQKDRGVIIAVSPTSRLNSSRIQIKRDVYVLGDIGICQGSKGRLIITHPDYQGELSVARRGTTNEDSIVRLQKKGSLLVFYLRPAAVVE